MPHVDFMINLTQQLEAEKRIQKQIEDLREKYSRDNHVQLRMDRHQALVDQRMADIRKLMAAVATRN